MKKYTMQGIEAHQSLIRVDLYFVGRIRKILLINTVNVMPKKIVVEQLYIISFWNLKRRFAEFLAQALF